MGIYLDQLAALNQFPLYRDLHIRKCKEKKKVNILKKNWRSDTIYNNYFENFKDDKLKINLNIE